MATAIPPGGLAHWRRAVRVKVAHLIAPAIALAPALLPTGAHAATEVSLGPAATGFHYEEFDNGGLFNRERGIVPGLRVTLRSELGGLFSRIDLAFHGGEVGYSKPPRGDSTSGARFLTGSIEAGTWLDRERAWGAFLRLARRHWDRDIHGSAHVAALYEEYRWNELGLGGLRRWSGRAGGAWLHEVSATLFAVTSGRIFMQLSGVHGRSWDDDTLPLGDSVGLRLRYAATRDLGTHELRIEPYYEYWGFGRSQEHPLTSDGERTGLTVYEPRSESQRLGVSFGLVF